MLSTVISKVEVFAKNQNFQLTPDTFSLKYIAIPLVAKELQTLIHLGGEGFLALFTVGVKSHGVELVQLHDPDRALPFSI